MAEPESPAVSAVVLAGGRSQRMGRDKATVPLAGRSLLQWTIEAVADVRGLVEVVLVLAPRQETPRVTCAVPLRIVRDTTGAEGPLVALIAGVEAASAPVALVLGCDTPFVRPALLHLLVEEARSHSAVIPIVEGRVQPLCSAVRRDALPALAAAVTSGARAASAVADIPGTRLLDEEAWRATDPRGLSFIGVNTPEELAEASAVAAEILAEGEATSQGGPPSG
ncbi:MAG: molybdenum cofactor guanylyltransferase [Dehalococcoidia bacterium]